MSNPAQFVRVTAVAATLDEPNIDTDIIFPARFLLLMDRAGLGVHAFQDRRLRPDGTEDPGFALNQPAFRHAGILIGGANFGCGSSREQAVWALRDRGISCVIAPSFGEIFYANAFRGGLLPIVLGGDALERVRRRAATGAKLTADLEAQLIDLGPDGTLPFDVPPDRRAALLEGEDEIAVILGRDGAAIAAYEARRSGSHPWLVPPLSHDQEH